MGSASAYIISVVSVCLCSAIIQKMANTKGVNTSVINSLCGVILAIIVIAPVIKINISAIEDYISNVEIDANRYISAGEESSQNELRSVITEKVKAYILEKASFYDCNIKTIDVFLSAYTIPVPEGVLICGTYTPYMKNQLSGLIVTNLGISKENQQWIYQS